MRASVPAGGAAVVVAGWVVPRRRYAPGIAEDSPESRLSPRALLAPLRPPLWLQWVLSLLVVTVLIVLLVRFVDAESTPQAQAPHISAKGQRSLTHESTVLDGQEQAPHVVHFAAGISSVAAISHAVAAFINHQIDFGQLAGPVRDSLCFQVRGGRAPDLAFRCSVLARNTSFPFEGVVNPRTRVVTYCKHNPPPAPHVVVPISRRCLV
jgi:hypothetical protein